MNARGAHRYNRKRDSNEPDIKAALKARGFDIYAMDTPCDLLCHAPLSGRTFLVEVKMPDGTLSKAQREFWPTWRGEKYIIVSVAEVESIPL
jgi:hypothetical protein